MKLAQLLNRLPAKDTPPPGAQPPPPPHPAGYHAAPNAGPRGAYARVSHSGGLSPPQPHRSSGPASLPAPAAHPHSLPAVLRASVPAHFAAPTHAAHTQHPHHFPPPVHAAHPHLAPHANPSIVPYPAAHPPFAPPHLHAAPPAPAQHASHPSPPHTLAISPASVAAVSPSPGHLHLMPLVRDTDHGLITPRHSDTLSPHSAKHDDYESAIAALKRLMAADLRRSAVIKQLPDLPWHTVEAALLYAQVSPAFTPPEMQLVVREWFQATPINYALLEDECFARDRRAIHAKIMSLEINYGSLKDTLGIPEIVAFEVANDWSKFMLSNLSALLPTYAPHQLHELVAAHYPHKLRWADEELQFITKGIDDDVDADLLAHHLPFKKPADVKAKRAYLSKKLQTSVPSEESKEEADHRRQIEEFIDTDLTASGIKRVVDRRSFLKIISDIEDVIVKRGGSENVPFTKPEMNVIRQGLKQEIGKSELRWELPFRTREEIEEKLKKTELACVRQKKFANDVERLIYEAQWYATMSDDSSSSRKTRRSRQEVELSDLRKEATTQQKVKKEDLTEEELEERQRRRDEKTRKRKETLKKKEEEKLRKLLLPRSRSRTPRPRKEGHSRVSALIEEAKWFQSVTGDGKYVKKGEKRNRVPTYHLIPEFQNRQTLKSAQKKLVEKKQKKRRGRPPRSSSPQTEDSESGDELERLQEVIDNENLTDATEISPFDPVSIVEDTAVPLNSRQLFNDSIAAGSLAPHLVLFSPDVLKMLEHDSELPINNTVAAKVIKEHLRSYKSLPDSFPPLHVLGEGTETIANPRNILHIRYLLYPQHTEQYVLATPKSNELDPIYEIQKVFQIHYALYFSYSTVIRDIIYDDFCKPLQEAVDNNNFREFMLIIDKWNALMLELTPYAIEMDPSIDINESLRTYLPKSYKFQPTVRELKLDTFYMEVINDGEVTDEPSTRTRLRNAQDSERPHFRTPLRELAMNSAPLTEKFKTRFRHLKPMNYSDSFIHLLNKMSEISRFCVQQLLLRAYTRIVSPDSRKLRSYKAFTAEVYGELLPSFVSEVLTKVELKPEQKFYDLGSGVGNTTFQAALEFGVKDSGGCELMEHASNLTSLQEAFMQKQLLAFGLKPLNLSFALHQSFVNNEEVKKKCVECDILIVNNYLFDFPLMVEVGKLLYGLKPGSKIISLRNFIPPRYKAGTEKTVLDYLKVEKFEMSDYFSVSWTANKVPYYISTVESTVRQEYL